MIRYVMSEDISNILSMMEQVKEAFPGYQEIEFLEALYKAIDCKNGVFGGKGRQTGRNAYVFLSGKGAYIFGSCAGIPKTGRGKTTN